MKVTQELTLYRLANRIIPMITKRYILEKGSKKHYCPRCNKKTLVRYIDTEVEQYLPEFYGRCDREINCAYFYNPYTNGYAKTRKEEEKAQQSNCIVRPLTLSTHRPISYVSLDKLKQSQTGYDKNNLVQWLIKVFDEDIATKLTNSYHIGTSKYWAGATVFWQVDDQGNVRSGKIMLYSPATGKRVTEPFNHITWIHKVLSLQDFNLKQCCFGEHLLKDDSLKPVAIVESEKTAIIASMYFADFIWLACGSLTQLNAEKCKVLVGRNVYLFPDLNGYDKWVGKANELSRLLPDTQFTVSNLLERNASDIDKTKGLDLADYLIKLDLKNF